MNVRTMTVPCPRCYLADALTCQVVRTGEGLWVSRRTQRCTCDVYAAWEVVWWAVRSHLSEEERRQRLCIARSPA
jgi:hypothetical protein